MRIMYMIGSRQPLSLMGSGSTRRLSTMSSTE